MSNGAEPTDIGSLEWIKFRQEQNHLQDKETGLKKLTNKMVENPFVPIGVLGTVAALCVGLYSMMKGNRKRSQKSMCWRIGCQAFAVGACIVGLEMKRRKDNEEKEKPEGSIKENNS